MHDTHQLIKCGLADEDISPLFLGVFPADRIPLFFPVCDWCLIANTDPADKRGQHWTVLGFWRNENFFFDSYGHEPVSYQPYWSRFNNWSKWDKNLQQLTSDVCGDWCLYWCTGFARVPSKDRLLRFMHKFSDDAGINDRHVVRVMHSRFPRILNSTKHINSLDVILRNRLKSIMYPQCLLTNQICVSRRN